MTAQLHLPSLFIEGFRGIQSLDLPKLGRVTLLAGENGVGKSTVLDSARLYAARGASKVVMGLLDAREEYSEGIDEDGNRTTFLDFRSLFHRGAEGRELAPIRIQTASRQFNLSVRLVEMDDEEAKTLDLEFWEDEQPKVLKVYIGKHSRIMRAGPMVYFDRTGRRLRVRDARPIRQAASSAEPWPSPIQNESLGPGLLGNEEIGRLWDAVTLTDGEDLAIEALRLVVGEDLERLNVIGEDSARYRQPRRRAVAKLKSQSAPVPLKRLGDGANRLLAIALALANSRDGILLIDEAENGIHYSVQTNLWRMVFRAAEAANVQVIAATHSWDCIAGFAAAAVESDADGTLFRLDRYGGELHGVLYSEENLEVAARQRTEVR